MKTFALLISVLVFLPSIEATGGANICLNMIVKDEKEVIERCLQSVLPIIDYWVIVDTGSSDGTQDVIRNFMKARNVPGELHESAWVDFSHNRNIALMLAKDKAEYLFFIDADEYLEYDPAFRLPVLDKDFYYITVSHAGSKYGKVQLINTRLEWQWKGVLHEAIYSSGVKSSETLENVKTIYTTEGARSKDPLKYQKDAKILEEALSKEPDNSRCVFYLAQSWKDAGNHSQALKYYEKRAQMGGWDQEIYWSLLQAAILKELLEIPDQAVFESYKTAHRYRPFRHEALYHLARFSRKQGDFEKAYRFSKEALNLPPSKDILFVQHWIADYGALFELSIAAYWLENYEESRQASLKLLANFNLPEDMRRYVENNLYFADVKVYQTKSHAFVEP